MSESGLTPTSNRHTRPKRRSLAAIGTEPPRKKARSLLADDEDSTSSSDDTAGGALLPSENPSNLLTINQEFAKRFEHNKRREELHKLEERYGKSETNSKRGLDASESEGETGSSTDSEDEDDDGVLALGDLDQQVQATLNAIRSKDPRVYDKNTTFYTDPADQGDEQSAVETKQKPMYLSDYHRQNIMQAVADIDDNDDLPTYAQEQDKLKATILQEMHASADAAESNGASENDQDEDFLVPKVSTKRGPNERSHVATVRNLPDVNSADNDPEKFLSDFMSARAWVPQAGSRFVPFESDDEEEEKRADEFEDAYNLRFEDPNVLNEKLVSHARDAAARYSVRREEVTGRKKTRETERAKREAEKQEREEEKARLRKLRITDAEEKVKKIKEAAGLGKDHLEINDWSKFLEEGWDTERWEEEMRKRFGDAYYKDPDIEGFASTAGEGKRKIKKPKWEDDIPIDDLVPDFTEHDRSTKPPFSLSDLDSDENGPPGSRSDPSESTPTTPHLDKKRKLDEEKEFKKQARNERRQIEQLIDKSLVVDKKLADMGAKHAGTFRYRETSPINYGLTAQDILMASDSQLNQYAGLKKLATFRDSTKKSKDHKRLGKKARLRQWRKETFGSEHGSQKTLADVLAGQGDGGSVPALEKGSNVVEGSRRKRHGKGRVQGKSS
ncbi:MAG: hypothetical protein L6R38_001375 [Xanthoria sp. 2 TBL-2021]|nr:MAG: hypothetical protein L6R38_001375 [Xanthoria sp. 2 TBL-2021]